MFITRTYQVHGKHLTLSLAQHALNVRKSECTILKVASVLCAYGALAAETQKQKENTFFILIFVCASVCVFYNVCVSHFDILFALYPHTLTHTHTWKRARVWVCSVLGSFYSTVQVTVQCQFAQSWQTKALTQSSRIRLFFRSYVQCIPVNAAIAARAAACKHTMQCVFFPSNNSNTEACVKWIAAILLRSATQHNVDEVLMMCTAHFQNTLLRIQWWHKRTVCACHESRSCAYALHRCRHNNYYYYYFAIEAVVVCQ